MTVDEELVLLEEAMRRLKVEYDVYFGGGAKKPPSDSEWRVQTMLKKYSDSQKLTFAQRFKYNTIAQRYAIYSDLWRQKLKIKEEGYRRPQDAVLGIQGMRHAEEQAAANALAENAGADASPAAGPTPESPRVVCSNPDAELDSVRLLYDAMVSARKKTGERAPGSFESFWLFVKRKTDQLRKEYHCQAVEYCVELQGGQARLRAKVKN